MKYLERFNLFKKVKKFTTEEILDWYKPIIQDLSDYLLETFDEFNIPENHSGQYWDDSYWKICSDHHIEIKSPYHIDVLMKLESIQSQIERRLGRPILIEESDAFGPGRSYPNICIYLRQPGTKDKALDARTIMESWNPFKKKEKVPDNYWLYNEIEYIEANDYLCSHRLCDFEKSEIDEIRSVFKYNKLEMFDGHDIKLIKSPFKIWHKDLIKSSFRIIKCDDEYFIVKKLVTNLNALSGFASIADESTPRYFLCDTMDGVKQLLSKYK